MTAEEEQLIFKDICARIPYGLIVHSLGLPHEQKLVGYIPDIEEYNIKPYLRPMSSITEEELKELNEKYGNIAYFFIQEPPYYHGLQAQHSDIGSIEISEFSEIYDWLLEHHFDFRGLIEKGLALVAPKDMYKTE